jgi:hypothetical protein
MELRLLLTPGQGDPALLLAQFAPEDLTELDCSKAPIGDDLMPAVGRLTRLRFLELESTQVTDAGLKALAGLKNLEGLSVRNCPIKGPGMAALAGLEKLKALRFAIIKKSDDDALKYLAGFKHLEVLDIKELDAQGNTQIFMMNMPELPTVKELDLSEHPNLKDEDLVYLKRLPNLERLRFARTGLKGPGLKYLAPLQKLETLIIERTPVNGPGLASLARGEVHAAGVHLYDAETREYNVPFVRAALPGRKVVLINLGVWEEGLLVQPGNPMSSSVRPTSRSQDCESSTGRRGPAPANSWSGPWLLRTSLAPPWLALTGRSAATWRWPRRSRQGGRRPA